MKVTPESDPAAYAVHAANVLPEVVAALREIDGILDDETLSVPIAWDRMIGLARAALAKADAS